MQQQLQHTVAYTRENLFLTVLSNKIMEARLGFDFLLNRVPFLDDLNDAAAIAAHRSTVLESDELSYPYLHTLITYRLE